MKWIKTSWQGSNTLGHTYILHIRFRTWTERLLLEKELSAETKLTGFARLMYSVQIFVFQVYFLLCKELRILILVFCRIQT